MLRAAATLRQAERDTLALWRLVEAYLTRWRIEDTLRFAK